MSIQPEDKLLLTSVVTLSGERGKYAGCNTMITADEDRQVLVFNFRLAELIQA